MAYEFEAESESKGGERLFGGHSGRLFCLITLIAICLQFAQRMIPPLLPAITADLGISASLAGIAVSLLQLGRASMEYPGGRLADELSRTTVVLVAIGFGIVGVVVLAMSTVYAVFLVAVAVLGMSIGLYVPASRTLLSDVFHERRGRAFGINMIGTDLSGVAAAGLAVWIVSVSTWRGLFLPLAAVLLPLPVGFYLLSREPVRVERPTLGLRTTMNRVFRTASMRWLLVTYALFMTATNGVMSFLPTFLVDARGVSLSLAGAAFGLVFAVGVVARPVGGTFSDRLPRPAVAGGGLLVAAGGLGLLIAAPSDVTALVGVAVFAFGLKGFPPAMQAHLMDRFPDDSMGSDFGAFRAIYKTVGSLGPGLTGFVADTYGFVAAFVGLCGLLLGGALVLGWFSAVGWPDSGG